MIRKSVAAAVLASGMLMLPAFASAISITNGKLVTTNFTHADTGAEAVKLTDTDGLTDTAQAFLLLELAGFAPNNKFGIYGFTQSGSTVTLGSTLQVFDGAASAPLSNVKLLFDLSAGTVKNLKSGATASIGSTFGFYIDTPESNTFYTHKALNADGFDHFLLYDTLNNTDDELFGSNVAVAIEDLLGGGDKDYDDMVVGVTDVAPVPEPGTILLLGGGLIGLGLYGRKRAKKNS